MVVAHQGNDNNSASVTKAQLAGLPVRVRFVSETGAGFDIPGYDRVTIGRDMRENHTTVDLTSMDGARHGISRRHVELLPLDGQLTVQDLYSVNGTWLNGEMLEPEQRYPLAHNDILQVGQIRFRIQFSAELMTPTQ